MNKFRIFSKSVLVILISFLAYSVLFADIEPKKPWTVLVYIAGDNDLEPYVNQDLNEMKRAANDNVNILAFVNTHRNGEQKLSKRLVITKDNIKQEGPDLINLDSGRPSTVIEAGKWALGFPSNNFGIIFWDHGSGPLNRNSDISLMGRGVCYDDTTGNYLNDYDLQLALDTLFKSRGKKLDIVAFDACLMANIETSFIVEPYADFLIASQETVAATGYDYNMFKSLEKEYLTSNLFASRIIKSYDFCYKLSKEDYTLSAVKLSNTPTLFNNINQLSQTLVSYLEKQKDHSVDKAITKAGFSNPNIRFDEPEYVDLYNFYINLLQSIKSMNLEKSEITNLTNIIQEGLYLIRRAVSFWVSSPRYSIVRGISIYLPKNKVHNSYNKLFWATQTKWASFLNSYLTAKIN